MHNKGKFRKIQTPLNDENGQVNWTSKVIIENIKRKLQMDRTAREGENILPRGRLQNVTDGGHALVIWKDICSGRTTAGISTAALCPPQAIETA